MILYCGVVVPFLVAHFVWCLNNNDNDYYLVMFAWCFFLFLAGFDLLVWPQIARKLKSRSLLDPCRAPRSGLWLVSQGRDMVTASLGSCKSAFSAHTLPSLWIPSKLWFAFCLDVWTEQLLANSWIFRIKPLEVKNFSRGADFATEQRHTLPSTNLAPEGPLKRTCFFCFLAQFFGSLPEFQDSDSSHFSGLVAIFVSNT